MVTAPAAGVEYNEVSATGSLLDLALDGPAVLARLRHQCCQ
jgi:hypothetical protein